MSESRLQGGEWSGANPLSTEAHGKQRQELQASLQRCFWARRETTPSDRIGHPSGLILHSFIRYSSFLHSPGLSTWNSGRPAFIYVYPRQQYPSESNRNMTAIFICVSLYRAYLTLHLLFWWAWLMGISRKFLAPDLVGPVLRLQCSSKRTFISSAIHCCLSSHHRPNKWMAPT
jgi:hypothetical protein